MTEQRPPDDAKAKAERQLRQVLAAEAKSERDMREKIQKGFYGCMGVIVLLMLVAFLFF